MTEQHECNWRILLVMPNSATAQIRIICRICNEHLLRQNAEAMLNEYETLKKENAALGELLSPLIDIELERDTLKKATEVSRTNIVAFIPYLDDHYKDDPWLCSLSRTLQATADILEG